MFKTLLNQIPFIGSALSFVTGNIRTVIEYALVALLMAIGGTAITLWFKTKALESKADALQYNLSLEQTVNNYQTQAIRDYQNLRERDAKAMDTIVRSMDVLASKNSSHKQKLSTLEKNNALVRETLNAPVPSALNCLYNPSTCEQGGDKGREGVASPSPVQPVQGTR
jgi:hypothetical protein